MHIINKKKKQVLLSASFCLKGVFKLRTQSPKRHNKLQVMRIYVQHNDVSVLHIHEYEGVYVYVKNLLFHKK